MHQLFIISSSVDSKPPLQSGLPTFFIIGEFTVDSKGCNKPRRTKTRFIFPPTLLISIFILHLHLFSRDISSPILTINVFKKQKTDSLHLDGNTNRKKYSFLHWQQIFFFTEMTIERESYHFTRFDRYKRSTRATGTFVKWAGIMERPIAWRSGSLQILFR